MTVRECQEWATAQHVLIAANGLPVRYPELGPVLRFELPTWPHQLAWLCRFLSDSLQPRDEAVLWVKEFGTFPSTENLHLYYRVRQSYGDVRLLEEAPGHSFLDQEDADLQTFLLMGIVNGWEMHLFTRTADDDPGPSARAIIAHDNEWIALYHRDADVVNEWRQQIEGDYTILVDRGE